jgi:hypothetical protein
MSSSRLFFTTLVVMCICVATFSAQNVPPIVGIWNLNREKSRLPSVPAGWFDIRRYTMRPDGYLVGLLVTSNDRGVHFLQFTAKSDGKDYPEYSDDLLADMIAAAKPTTRTYAETVIDEFTTAWIDKVNGKIVAAGRKTVSTDRQTLTITVQGRSQVTVYDRQ